MPEPAEGILDSLSVDVEDYYHVANFASVIQRSSWQTLESRVEQNTRRLMDLFEGEGVRATFFVLGDVARSHPALVREIAGRGHEVASHGWEHELVYQMGPKGFREEVRISRDLLSDITGVCPLGYRASNFSVTAETPWAFEILAEEGFRYDSSTFPVRHHRYGIPGGQRFPFEVSHGDGRPALVEFPLTTLRLLRWNIPAAGGGYLRLLPLAVVQSAIRQAHRAGQPAILYVHPWEIDRDQPRIRGVSVLARVRHYGRLAKTESRLRKILARGRFAPLRDLLPRMSQNRPAART